MKTFQDFSRIFRPLTALAKPNPQWKVMSVYTDLFTLNDQRAFLFCALYLRVILCLQTARDSLSYSRSDLCQEIFRVECIIERLEDF